MASAPASVKLRKVERDADMDDDDEDSPLGQPMRTPPPEATPHGGVGGMDTPEHGATDDEELIPTEQFGSESEEEAGGNEIVTKKDLDAIMLVFQAQTLQAVHQGQQQLQAAIQQSMHMVIKRYDTGVKERFAVVDTVSDGLNSMLQYWKEKTLRF